MSDEQRKDEETEVEGHAYPRVGLNDEPADEVEGHAYPRVARTTSRLTRSRVTHIRGSV